MAKIELKDKFITTTDKEKEIIVTHLTIRQSIFFLHLRIVALEIIAAFFVVSFHAILFAAQSRQLISEELIVFNIPLFLGLVAVKVIILIYIIIQWLNQYYEISPSEVRFRKGLLFRREEQILLEHVGSLKLEQGAFGRIFNFGTIKLFNWTTEKEDVMYLIHNPIKYQKILQHLLPSADTEKKALREHLLEVDEDA